MKLLEIHGDKGKPSMPLCECVMKLGIMMLVLSTNNVQGVNMKMQDTNSASSPEIPHPGMHTYHSATFFGDSMLWNAKHTILHLVWRFHAPGIAQLTILHLVWRFHAPGIAQLTILHLLWRFRAPGIAQLTILHLLWRFRAPGIAQLTILHLLWRFHAPGIAQLTILHLLWRFSGPRVHTLL
jgi:hypothetical protein